MHLKGLFVLLLILNISIIYTQDDVEDQDYASNFDDQDENQDFDSQKYQDNMRTQQQEPQKEQIQQMQSIATACIVLFKHRIYHEQKELNEVIKSYEQKDQMKKVYSKIQGSLLEECYQQMDFETSQKVQKAANNKDFDYKDYSHYSMRFQYSDYLASNEKDLELTDMQDQLIKFQEQFEKHMQQQQENQEEDDFYDNYTEQDQVPPPPQIMGLDFFEQFNNYGKAGVIFVFLMLVLVIWQLSVKYIDYLQQAGPVKKNLQKKSK